MMKYKSIFFCTAHPTKDMGGVKQYFIKNSDFFVTFHFFLGFSTDAPYMEKYQGGKKIYERKFSFYKGKNKLIQNILNYLYFSFILIRHVKRDSFLLINAPIYCFLNSFFRLMKGFKYVLWIGDYYPDKRFPMNFYHKMVNFYNEHIPYVLYVSPPLKKIYLSKTSQIKNFRKTSPLGIIKNLKKTHMLPNKDITLGFIGIIRMQQGLDLAFSYLKQVENCKLEIIGDGYYLKHYKQLAKKLGIEDKVIFYGRVDDISSVIARWDIGIALYENTKDNLSVYCEPTKIKNYLSYGLPVVTTETTYFYKEIQAFKAGCIVKEDTDSLDKAIRQIKGKYDEYLIGVQALVDKYEYMSWYDKQFDFLR